MKRIFEVLEENNISVDEYEEDSKLCGYELNTYTNGGVNMIIFLDFRHGGDPLNEDSFIAEFKSYLNNFDITDEIMLHREDQRYVKEFTLTQSVKDFLGWKKEMKKIIKKASLSLK